MSFELQWGRASSARKALPTVGVDGREKMLQWGRASSTRKAATDREVVGLIPVASMGPCFISTEGVPPRMDSALLLRCFNGAVLHQHGRRRVVMYHLAMLVKLQWGRASSARKA